MILSSLLLLWIFNVSCVWCVCLQQAAHADSPIYVTSTFALRAYIYHVCASTVLWSTLVHVCSMNQPYPCSQRTHKLSIRWHNDDAYVAERVWCFCLHSAAALNSELQQWQAQMPHIRILFTTQRAYDRDKQTNSSMPLTMLITHISHSFIHIYGSFV